MRDRIREALLRGAKDETGGALAITLAVVVVVTILVAGGVYLATQGAEQATARDSEQLAQEAAESGLNAASARLAAEDDTSLYDGGADDSVWSPAGGGKTLPLENSKVRVTMKYVGQNREGFSEFAVQASGTSDQAKRILKGTLVDDGLDSYGPVALDDPATAAPGETIPINVVGNDYDPDDQLITLVGPRTLATTHGSVECSSDGLCDYFARDSVPDGMDSYQDTFEYEITDPDAQRDSAIVTITVVEKTTIPPEPPGAVNDTYEMMRANTKTFNVLANDERGTAGNTLKMAGKDDDSLSGTLNCKVNGTCSYSPPKSLKVEKETFTYDVADGNGPGEPETARVTLKIIDPDKPEKQDPPDIPPPARRCLNLVPSQQVLGKEGLNLFRPTPNSERFSGSGANSIRTGSGNDRVTISRGASRIETGAGNDIIVVGDGATSVDSGPGTDLVVIMDGAIKVEGNSGDDIICLGDGAASADGGTGDDIIRNEEGASIVDGGTGDDILIGTRGVANKQGGTGDDKLRFSGDGIGMLEPGPGEDTLDVTGPSIANIQIRDGSTDEATVRGGGMCKIDKDAKDRVRGCS